MYVLHVKYLKEVWVFIKIEVRRLGEIPVAKVFDCPGLAYLSCAFYDQGLASFLIMPF